MTKKKTGRPSASPSTGNVDIRFVEPPQASKNDGPVRRETTEVDMSWLEEEKPASVRVNEPALRRETVVRREAVAAPTSAGRTSSSRTAPPARGATTKGPAARVIVRKVSSAKKEMDVAPPEPAEAASESPLSRASALEPPPFPPLPARVARSQMRLTPTIPREDALDSVPPRQRSSKPPRCT